MKDKKYIYIDELKVQIKKERFKIKQSYPLLDNRVSIIELTRCLDHSFAYVSYVLKKEDKEYENASIIFRFISTGFYNSIKNFIDDNISHSGFPLLASNSNSIKWANDVNIRFGHIGFTERFIWLAKQGLFKISKKGNSFRFKNIAPNPLSERLVVEDFYWWQKQMNFSKEELIRLEYLKPIVEKQILEEVSIWKEHFIKYGCTKELDENYEIVGRFLRRRMVGSDAFPLDSKFGLLTFNEILNIIEAIIGYAVKHNHHCISLLNKTKKKINPWNIYTLPYRLDDLAKSISIQKGLDYQSVYDFLVKFSIDKNNIDYLGDSPGNAPPPLIRISKEFVLRSLAGALSNPFAYLTRSLKFSYEKDYFNAVNHREAVFKEELYKLFEGPNYVTISSNINLKLNGNIYTDIDAVIYDIKSNKLLLVQLKWLDDFGNSMKMRYSMSNNFYGSCIKWIDRVEDWLSKKGISELLKKDVKLKSIPDTVDIQLMILGRNFSHFSDQKEDPRAVWCSWYSLVRLISENKEKEGDINLIIEGLKERTSKHERVLKTSKIEDLKLQIGDYKVTISI